MSSIFVTPEGNWKLGGLEDVEYVLKNSKLHIRKIKKKLLHTYFFFRKLSKTTTEDDLNGFVGLVKELIPVDGKLGKLHTNLPIYTYYPLS